MRPEPQLLHGRGHGNQYFATSRKHTKNAYEKAPKMKPKSLQVRVWTPPKKHSESGCLKQCNMFENASLNGPLNRLKIDEKTHLGTPGTAEAHCYTPGTKTHTNQPKTRLGTRTPTKKQRRPKTFQEHPTLAEVFHRGSDAVSLPQKLSLRGAASRSLHQKPPAASKFPQRGGLGEAHLDIYIYIYIQGIYIGLYLLFVSVVCICCLYLSFVSVACICRLYLSVVCIYLFFVSVVRVCFV